MPKYSDQSAEKLKTCDKQLQHLFNEVIKHYDCTIADGYRGEYLQEIAVRSGASRLHYPNSKHNQTPSKAVDAIPYPWKWSRAKESIYFAGFVMGIASQLGINLRWGGDWDMDTDQEDQRLKDYPHFEIE